MRIAIDLDGVCYEFQRTYRYMMRTYRGVDMPPVDEFWYEWNAADQYTAPEDRDWIWKEGIDLGLFRYGHVTTGAVVGLRQLVSFGHKLVVVTHRPERAVPDTLAWLNYINIPWAEVHILSNGEPKSSVTADILVDDKPENIEDWYHSQDHLAAIVYDRPWNWACPAGIRARDWKEVVQWIQELSM